MTYKKGTSVVLIALLSLGFLTNSVTSQAADKDTNFNVSKSLAENTIKLAKEMNLTIQDLKMELETIKKS